MIEGGLIQKWISRYWPQTPCDAGAGTLSASHAITLEETAGAFLVLLTGVAVASLLLLIENKSHVMRQIVLRLGAVDRWFVSRHSRQPHPTPRISIKGKLG